MSYSLAEAATATGTNKTTILRAIKSGKVSGTRDEQGAWRIEPAEVHRVYPPVARTDAEPYTTQQDAMADVLVAELRATIADVRRDRDHWREAHERGQAALAEALAAQAAAQRQLAPPAATPIEQDATPAAAPRRRWWRRVG